MIRRRSVLDRVSWLLPLGLAACTAAQAATYYVRTDGGDPGQCTGLADAAYPGRGRGKACAWKHPFHALPPDGSPRIAGGDTLIIGEGSYMIGWGAPGLGSGERCYAEASYDCHPSPIPSGPSVNARTRILGSGHDTGCRTPPELWGTERVGSVLDLEGSSNVEIGCLEITDQSDCVELHSDAAAKCLRDARPYGTWGSVGIWAKGSRNVLLHDLDIHGMASRGILAGGLTDWTLERVRIRANGWAGWDGDVGAGSVNAGRIVLRDVEIAWNGCGERWETGEPHACWAQEAGGYGDGLGTARTGGEWLIEDSRIHHNTSDGIDLLYLDGKAGSSVTLRRVRAEANAGNQIKTNGTATIENSVVVGSCAWFANRFDMLPGDQCRARGNALSVGLVAGQAVTIRHNTITGEGDCLILTSGGPATARVEIRNNALLGQIDYWANLNGNPGELACGHYADNSLAAVDFAGNAFWNVRSGQCPPGSVCGAGLTGLKLNEPGMAGFDPVPLPGSPLIGRAPAAMSQDFRGRARISARPADIGAIEVPDAK